jgi:hypothetical protein
MAISNNTAAPITIDQMIASARDQCAKYSTELKRLRLTRLSLQTQIADALVEFNEADRILKALTPREPKVRAPKSKKETNG